MKTHRLARVSEVVREVAASTILMEVRDPRVKNVTVTRAETSADLQHAKVFVSIMGSDAEQRRTLKALQNAAGFIQSRLADRLTTRFLPQILFVIDEGVKKSLEVARLLQAERDRDNPPAAEVGELDDATDTDGEANESTEEPGFAGKPEVSGDGSNRGS